MASEISSSQLKAISDINRSHLKAITEAVDEIESKYFESDQIHLGDEKLVITVLKTGSTVCLPLSKKDCAGGP